MTVTELERLIVTWIEPWPELLSAYQQLRDERLKHAKSDLERRQVASEYEGQLECMIKLPVSTPQL